MATNISAIYSTYEDLLAQVDQEFDRVRNIFLPQMQCRNGCSSCCNQLFSISATVVLPLKDGPDIPYPFVPPKD